MNVDQLQTEPFAGWDAVRQTVSAIGPLRALRYLLLRVAEEQQHDGVFQGDGTHNYINHPIAARAILRVWADAPAAPTVVELVQPIDAQEETEILHALRQFNELSRTRLAQSRRPDYDTHGRFSQAHIERVVEALWLQTLLARGRSNAPKYEIARAWLMLRRFWQERKEEVRGAIEHRLREPLDTAFQSLEHGLFLNVAAFKARGIIVSTRDMFRHTEFRDQLPTILDLYVKPAGEVAGPWADVESVAQRGIESAFQYEPLVRLGANAIVAPDLGLVLCGITDRVITSTVANYAVDGEHVLEAAQTVLGLVFERYVQRLVEECARNSRGSRFVQEFQLDDQSASPDAIIVEAEVTLFEAKATRYPVPFADHLDAASFLGWLRKVAGERPGQRGPITQGARFVRKWREHDGACERELGAFRTNTDLRYVIISAEDLPVFAHWQKFRETLWRPQLGQEEQVLDERTLFVSIHDLEALAATLIALGARNTPRTIGELLDEWAAYWNRGAHILESPLPSENPRG